MSTRTAAKPCPKCRGVSQHPDVEGCNGCMECDFTGTLAGYRRMQRMTREANAEGKRMAAEHQEYVKRGVCSQCGACSREEAPQKCTATQSITGDYSCAGDDLWPEQE